MLLLSGSTQLSALSNCNLGASCRPDLPFLCVLTLCSVKGSGGSCPQGRVSRELSGTSGLPCSAQPRAVLMVIRVSQCSQFPGKVTVMRQVPAKARSQSAAQGLDHARHQAQVWQECKHTCEARACLFLLPCAGASCCYPAVNGKVEMHYSPSKTLVSNNMMSY